MTIALFVSDRLPLSEITVMLRGEGVDMSAFVLNSQLSPNDIPSKIKKSVLITNEHGIVSLGERIECVREIIGQEAFLILCSPQPTSSDRKLLIKCGVSEIITPQSWSVGHIVERILGQLILDGDIAPNSCGTMRGGTKSLRDLYSNIEKVAALSEPILILGETGTGKELVAREIHNRSGRQDSYLPVNCPEITPELISSELFGHEKGAFSGADRARVGLIVSAGKGTVFLDEIGELDIQSQARLLRVLEDRKVRRVGANSFEVVQARIVLATNRELQEACDEGRFRRDLFERIRGFTLELPPLRERKADIPILVTYFIDKFNEEYKTNVQIPPGSLDYLFQYDWPGNVRELRAVVRKAAVYADSSRHVNSLILQESIRGRDAKRLRNVVPFDPAADTWRDLLNRAQAIYFRALLTQTNGNREAAIKLSGLSKSQFFEKIKEISKES
jgi:DNA-binding NtrC family response regulator